MEGIEDLELATEGDVGAGEALREDPVREDVDGESRPRPDMLGMGDGIGAFASETILIPRLVLVLAGMNKVSWLLGAGIAIRCG